MHGIEMRKSKIIWMWLVLAPVWLQAQEFRWVSVSRIDPMSVLPERYFELRETVRSKVPPAWDRTNPNSLLWILISDRNELAHLVVQEDEWGAMRTAALSDNLVRSFFCGRNSVRLEAAVFSETGRMSETHGQRERLVEEILRHLNQCGRSP